ncbi:hypothetical protein EDB85DRAFT_2147639 [Lactarius pseudohatsudake]|nr:hypothetical protein EDB85DRAFT_2147639 [Lactarius pseudohatsudake]
MAPSIRHLPQIADEVLSKLECPSVARRFRVEESAAPMNYVDQPRTWNFFRDRLEPGAYRTTGGCSTKLVPRSDVPTKKGHPMILVDANQDIWERRWFVLQRYYPVLLSPLVSGTYTLPRPYLHVYTQSNEVEEMIVISLDGVNVESNPDMESLLGKRFTFTLFTSSNFHALAAPSLKGTASMDY